MSNYLLPAIATWDEWRPIFTDAAVWRPVVARVWAGDELLRAATGIHAPARIEMGYPGTCAVLLVEGVAVIKFFPPMVVRDFERERSVYRLLSGRVTPLPEFLSAGVYHDRIDWPYLVVSRLAGEAWRDAWPRIPVADRRAILGELGRVMRTVHATSLPLAGPWPSALAWEALWRARLPHISSELSKQTAFSAALISELEALLAATDWSTARPVLLHADLTEDHLLVGERAGHWKPTGLIDWADAEVGDPLYDWVTLWFSICRRDGALFRAFLAEYDPGHPFGEVDIDRLLAMMLLHRFGAGIVGEVLSVEAQRRLGSVAEMRRVLFGDLLRRA